jgi:VWFA-related protein
MRHTCSAIARRVLLVCLALVCSRCVSHAQGNGQDGKVHLDVVVSDAAGRPVTGLKAQEFRLYVDGEERQIATFAAYDDFTAKPDPATQMIIVIDSLNNGFVEMGYMRQGLEKFLRENEGRLRQPTTIAQLDPSGIQYLSQPSRDGNALAAIVEKLDPNVKTKGIDVLPISLNALVAVAEKEVNEPGRKLLVWLGPGWPTPMPPTATPTTVDERNQRAYYAIAVQIAKLLHDARMVLYGGYSAGEFYMRDFLKPVKKASDMDARGLRLNVLAIKSGGRGELPETNRDSVIADALEHAAAEANSFYEISFNPAKSPGVDEFHEVRVAVKWPVLKVRTISGFYGRPEPEHRASKKEEAAVPQGTASERPAASVSPQLVTVAQLAELVEAIKRKPDGDAEKEIEQLQLTERLSSPKLAMLSAELSGAKAKAAVLKVGDFSAFLEPPTGEIPDMARPEISEQRQILSRAVDYLKNTIPKLPNFSAKRLTTSFKAFSEPQGAKSSHASGGSLQSVGEFRATVLYRDGKEVARANGAEERGLVTTGTFGPILSTAIIDAAHGWTGWGRWETGPNGPMAVFRLKVQQKDSHYEVSFPDAMPGGGSIGVMAPTAYHGEIGIDPHSGAILRLVLEADPELGSSMNRADIMVEYGTVVIGGKEYTCPLRSVSISSGKVPYFANAMDLGSPAETRGVTRLNDVIFSDYHVFRSEMRIVPSTPEH